MDPLTDSAAITIQLSQPKEKTRFVDPNIKVGKPIILYVGKPTEKPKAKQTGSYTNKHVSGKNYHGKGGKKRAAQSADKKAKTNNDPVKDTDWKPAKNDREAFKDEDKRIQNDGGVENKNNYNQRNSPGKKYNKEDNKQ